VLQMSQEWPLQVKLSTKAEKKGRKYHFKNKFVDVTVTSNSYKSAVAGGICVSYIEKLGHGLKMHLSSVSYEVVL